MITATLTAQAVFQCRGMRGLIYKLYIMTFHFGEVFKLRCVKSFTSRNKCKERESVAIVSFRRGERHKYSHVAMARTVQLQFVREG